MYVCIVGGLYIWMEGGGRCELDEESSLSASQTSALLFAGMKCDYRNLR